MSYLSCRVQLNYKIMSVLTFLFVLGVKEDPTEMSVF